jgi:purine-binding chemotaxis protein CheW
VSVEAGSDAVGSDAVALQVLEQVWARRAAQIAQVPLQAEEGRQIELVLVRLGREIYGLEVGHVFDIRPSREITPVPRLPQWVAGVVNVRGRILSAIDLGRFFGLGTTSLSAETGSSAAGQYLVVVETPEMEVALLVDEVLAVQAIPDSQVQDAAGTVRGLSPEYVLGIASMATHPQSHNGNAAGTALLVILDLVAILADPQLIVNEEVL